MTIFKIELTETYKKIIDVEASSVEEVLSITKKLYNDGGIVLDYDDFIGVEFQILDRK